MICKHCGEDMNGDGYHSAYVCPNVPEDVDTDVAPDTDPLYCDFEDFEND